jgi:hypothetical protein
VPSFDRTRQRQQSGRRGGAAANVPALPNLGPGGTRAPARGVTGSKLGRRARTRPEPVKHKL